MAKYAIRFLKQGLVEIECSNDLSRDEIIEFGKSIIDSMSDQDLIMAMSDCVPSGANPTRFDADSFQVEAIEDIDNNYELLHATDLWNKYIS